MSDIRFYLDENMSPVIAEQLMKVGIDALTVRDSGELGDEDINHLQRATQMGRVLCTHDADYLRLNAQGVEHAGIAFSRQYRTAIGSLVNALRELHGTTSAEEIYGRVHFLNVK